MIKTKFKKDFITLNDVLTFIKTDDFGPNYETVIIAALKARRKSDASKVKSEITVGLLLSFNRTEYMEYSRKSYEN